MTEPMQTMAGRCACGAVTFTALVPKTYGVCHCDMCRRWTGGVWMGVVADSTPQINGPIEVWTSSRMARRAFCQKCGSSVWHQANMAKTPTLGQGLFDDQSGWTRSREIFIDAKPDHYAFGAPAKAFTAAGTMIAYVLGRLPK